MASIDETIRKIIQDRCSVSRFGDGEMLLTNAHKRIGFQEGNPQLAQRLKEVLTSDNDKHLVCISDVFSIWNATTGKREDSGALTSLSTARGGTGYYFPDKPIIIHLSHVLIWILNRKENAGNGSMT